MKAVRLHADRQGLEALFVEDAPLPRPAPGEVLVKVQAAGVTRTEPTWSTNWKTKNGTARQFPIQGHEFSGVVSEVGARVDSKLVGQEVFALTDFQRDGAQAEYTLALPDELAPKPAGLEPENAAGVPLSALTAWQALFDYARLSFSQPVLIHGAAGGVGSQAVQIAHWAGAYVIATASMRDMGFVRSLGADECIPYHLTSFEKLVHDVDVVIDTVGGDTQERSWATLRKDGILVSVVAEPSPERAAAHQVRSAFFIVRPDRAQLTRIGDLIKIERLKPVTDSTYPIDEALRAYEHAQTGHPRGKVVLKIP